MKSGIILLSVSAILAGTAAAQTVPAKQVLYTCKDSVVLTPADAVYRIQRREVPGKSQLDSVFYLASNRLVRVATTTWQPNGDTLAVVEGRRANGGPEFVRHELGRKAHGEFRAYDAQGKLRRKSQFERGQERSTECFSETGAPADCATYQYTEKMPEFPGGQEALLGHIGRNIRYPAKALRKRQQGKVLVSFVIAETGQVRCLQVKQSLSPELDAEALRVLAKLPDFIPGQQNGETVPVYFTVPVTFAIR